MGHKNKCIKTEVQLEIFKIYFVHKAMLGMDQIFGAHLHNPLLNHLLVNTSLQICKLSGFFLGQIFGLKKFLLSSFMGTTWKLLLRTMLFPSNHFFSWFHWCTEALRSRFLFSNKIIKRTLNHKEERALKQFFQTLYFITFLWYWA